MPKIGLSPTQKGQLNQALKNSKVEQRKESLWKGPSDAGPLGGVTFSSVSKWLCNREHFRLKMVEGLVKEDIFNHSIEFGNMWHVMEECFASQKQMGACQTALKNYVIDLAKKYKEAGTQINQWYNVCLTQFPLYVAHWAKNPDVKSREPIFQEEVFQIPYSLPSGRKIYLRGKFDSVDRIKKGLYIQENKTKSEPDLEQIERDLPWDMQTMMYLSVLDLLRQRTYDGSLATRKELGGDKKANLGVRYNVIRRPLSGGKFSIKQKKGRMTKKGPVGVQTAEQFYAELGGIIKKNPKHFFIRFKMEVTKDDLANFQQKCLNPVLENVLDDYEWWSWCLKNNAVSVFDYTMRKQMFPAHQNRHYIFPTGIYNPQTEGRGTEYDEYINTGNMRGLVRTDKLFRELKDA